MYKVNYHKQVLKFLKSQSMEIREKVINCFEIIKENPFNNNLDIKPLKGFKNFYRLRIGKFRIIFKIEKEELIIYVISAGSRGDIY